MNLNNFPTLSFRSRKSKERDDYVRDSLSSLAVSSRLSFLSSSRDLKTDPFPLTFHEQWRHAECKVMKWYNRIAPSTQIASIEHRKTLEAPFFHEFLLIHLTDGAVCRLERMGDGSRVDAVRRLGCTAHDIIQWFPAEQYPTSPLALQPSEAVIHVQFPRVFDLLDVLAICFSIKQHRRASIYTLQRYNCYFLCNTILAILTRRVAEWETKLITPETWPKLVDDVLEELPRKKHDDAFDYCGIGVCSLLEPDCPNLVNDVVELLRSELKSSAHRSVAMGMADTLWHKDLQAAIVASLSEYVNAVTKKASDSGDSGAIGLRTLFPSRDDELYPDTEFRNSAIQRMLIKHDRSTHAMYIRRRNLDTYQIAKMRKIEQGGGSSRAIRLLASVIGPFLIWWAYDMGEARKLPGIGDQLDIRTWAQFQLTRVSYSLSAGGVAAFWALDEDHYTAYDETNDRRTHTGILLTYELCRLPVIDTRSKRLCVLNKDLETHEWAYSLRYCIARILIERLPDLGNSGATMVLGPNSSSHGTTDMHEHIHRRIQEHAKRVEGCQLAAAQLVEEDILWDMSEIWKSLPEGFGGVKAKRPSARVDRSTRRRPRALH